MNLKESFSEIFFTNGLEKPVTPKKKQVQSFAFPTSNDGATVLPYGGSVHTEFVDSNQTEKQLIETYRRISKLPEVEEAIDIIVQETFSEDSEGNIIFLDVDRLDVTDKIKDKIKTEFDNILNLLNFKSKGSDFFKRWYIDGRIAFHKIIDKEHPKKGIIELRYINPSSLEKVIEFEEIIENGVSQYKVVAEYFVYDPSNRTNLIDFNEGGAGIGANAYSVSNFWSMSNMSMYFTQGQRLQVTKDAIAFCTSGFYDEDFDAVLSYLHRAVKVANNLVMLEDSLVIYRMLRSNERRVFYVEVGDMTPTKAQQYVNEMMTKYKSDLAYDSVFGGIKDSRRFAALTEDLWIPRKDGKNSEVTKLEGGENLDKIDDVNYFLRKLYKALKIPVGRVINESQTIGLGRDSEITREELSFQKFIDKLRRNFSMLILDILRTQCALKEIISLEDWDDQISSTIDIKWSNDLFTTELKEQDIFKERLNTLQQAESYVGKYVTEDYILKNIMRYDDETIKELKKNEENVLADPNEIEY